jgi:hypothetical protein
MPFHQLLATYSGIDSDYRHELEAYHRETLDLRRRDPVHGQFGVLIRAERYERYKASLEAGRLRRVIHWALLFPRSIRARARRTASRIDPVARDLE